MQLEATEVGHPGQRRRFAEHHLLGTASGGKLQRDRLDPRRARRRRPLLVERRHAGAVGIADQHVGAPAGGAQRAVGDRQVVVDEVALGVPALREQHLVRVGDRHLAAADRSALREESRSPPAPDSTVAAGRSPRVGRRGPPGRSTPARSSRQPAPRRPRPRPLPLVDDTVAETCAARDSSSGCACRSRASAASSVTSSVSGVIDTHRCSTAQRSDWSSDDAIGTIVNQ